MDSDCLQKLQEIRRTVPVQVVDDARFLKDVTFRSQARIGVEYCVPEEALDAWRQAGRIGLHLRNFGQLSFNKPTWRISDTASCAPNLKATVIDSLWMFASPNSRAELFDGHESGNEEGTSTEWDAQCAKLWLWGQLQHRQFASSMTRRAQRHPG